LRFDDRQQKTTANGVALFRLYLGIESVYVCERVNILRLYYLNVVLLYCFRSSLLHCYYVLIASFTASVAADLDFVVASLLAFKMTFANTTSPVRRSRDTDLAESPCVESQAPWTAARCNRLLRPLSSKIALLRKVKNAEERKRASAEAAVQHTNAPPPHKSGKNGTKPSYFEEIEEEWNSNSRARKRMRHTYSSKAKLQTSWIAKPLEQNHSTCSAKDTAWQIKAPLLISSSNIDFSKPDLNKVSGVSQESGETFENPVRKDKRAYALPRASAKTNSDSARRRLQVLARHESKEVLKLYDGIYATLGALLQASNSTTETNKTGCRSLFSTCLKNTPRYMAREQLLMKMEDPHDDTDMSAVVYDELEALSVIDGWKPLRTVVRAHGIDIVGEAIEEKLIPLEVSHGLVCFCVHRGAHAEGESLMERMIASVVREPAQLHYCSPEQDFVVKALERFASRNGSYGFFYERITLILESKLPIPDNGFPKQSFHVRQALQSIISNDDRAAQAAQFLRAIVRKSWVPEGLSPSVVREVRMLVSRSARSRRDLRSAKGVQASTGSGMQLGAITPDTTTTPRATKEASLATANLLAVLVVISMIQFSNEEANSSDSGYPATALLHDMALETRQLLELMSYNEGTGSSSLVWEQSHLPLLASGMVSIGSSRPRTELSFACFEALDKLGLYSSQDKIAGKSGQFLSYIAECHKQATWSHTFDHSEKAASNNAFDFLKTMVQRLTQSPNPTSRNISKSTETLRSKIAMAAAFSFAETSGQPSHLEWALDVENAKGAQVDLSPRRVVDTTPARKSLGVKPLYRWEEGICEWIAKTPGVLIRERSVTASDSESDEREADIELGTTPTASFVKVLPLMPEASPDEQEKTGMREFSSQLGQRHGSARLRCVKIVVGNPENVDSARKVCPSYGSKTRASKAFEDLHVYDDTDELSAPLPLADYLPANQNEAPVLRPGIMKENKARTLQRSKTSSVFQGTESDGLAAKKNRVPDQENLDMNDDLSF